MIIFPSCRPTTRTAFTPRRLVAIGGRLVFVDDPVPPVPAAVPKESKASQPSTPGRSGEELPSKNVVVARHPLARDASRRLVSATNWPRQSLDGLRTRTLFHTRSLKGIVLPDPAVEKELSDDSEDDVDYAWKACMDAQRLNTIEIAPPDAFFMALWSSFVEAGPLWSDGGTVDLLQDFVAARCGAIARAGLLPQAVQHVRVLYEHGLIDVQAAADSVGVLVDEYTRFLPAEDGAANELRSNESERRPAS